MHESSSGSLIQNIPTVRLSLTSTEGFPNDFSADDINISGGGFISDFMDVNSDGEIAFTFTAQVWSFDNIIIFFSLCLYHHQQQQ
jgi:hypothetical protein